MMQFYEKDFEAVYRSARFEELMQLTRAEVIDRYTALECRAAELVRRAAQVGPAELPRGVAAAASATAGREPGADEA
ncbi:hypothetical protein MRX96_044373 [Rhipicephalus microplus]